MEGHPATGLIVTVILVIFNALISAVEASLLGVNEANIRKDEQEGNKKAEKLLKVIENPRRYINVIEIIATSLSVVVGMVFARRIAGYIRTSWFEDYYSEGNGIIAIVLMLLVYVVLIYLIVLLGVLLPKRLASRDPEKHAYRLLGVTRLLAGLLHPFSVLLEKNTNLILRIFGIDPNADDDNVTEEEIISIVNEGQEQGVLDDDEAEMISNIIEFDEKQVKDIMTHRRKIVALSAELDVEQAVEFMLQESFTRYPLFKTDIDNIIGVVNLKDAMKAYLEPAQKHQNITKISRDPYFIPDTQAVDVLLHDMQSKKVHMAVVIDEYGQTAGIVAMEDLLEEIVGDIQDEYDEEDDDIVAEEAGSYLVRGLISLSELCDETGLELKEEDEDKFDTLNGLMISLLDRIPEDGETATVEYGGFSIDILCIKDKMIESVRLTKLNQDEESDEESPDAKDLD